jgi:hypothetical protein
MDSTPLLTGLIEYKESLESHRAKLQSDYDGMKARTATCSHAYEGGDAREFWSKWHVTDQFFLDYLLELSKLIPMLNERIDALRQFDRGASRTG